MACKYYGNCEHQSGWCQSDSMLIKCTYGLNNLCSERIQKIVRLEEENKELKRLLLLALDDFAVNYINYCDCLECSDCPYHVDIEQFEGCSTRWKHLDEAVQILGDDADCWR